MLKVRAIALVVSVKILAMGLPTLRAADCPNITSVVSRENDAFATTKDGVFHLVRHTGNWAPVRLPESVPAGGKLADEPLNAPYVYYYVYSGGDGSRVAAGDKFGLYRTADGTDWSPVRQVGNIWSACVLTDGSVYFLGGRGVEQSRDRGATWTDIKHNIDWNSLQSIEPDPRNPKLVQIRVGYGLQEVILHANDDRYKWDDSYIPHNQLPLSREAFLARRPSPTRGRSEWVVATLCNYLQRPFGRTPLISAFSLSTDKPAYTFEAAAPKLVAVQLRFEPEGDSAVVISDATDPTAYWAVKVIFPDGRQAITETSVRDPELDERPPPPIAGAHDVQIDRAHPYHCTLDLDKLSDFHQPGEYTVEVVYNNQKRPQGSPAWDGLIDSEPFSVVVGGASTRPVP
jgi:hypothetical protein